MATSSEKSICPKYLNKKFFTECLRKGLAIDNLEICDFQMTSATKPGENYCSNVYRVLINYTIDRSQTKSISLVVKSIPTDGDRAYLEKFDVYVKETQVYFDFLPKIYRQLPKFRIAPKCYYAIKEPIRTIAFEDLKAEEYILADRISGLDETHCEIVLRKLAQFHAASIVALAKKPAFRKQFKNGLLTKESVEYGTCEVFYRGNLKKAAEMLTSMQGYERFAPKLMDIYVNYHSKILESVALDPDDIHVFDHSDLWVTNILFRYKDNIPIDTLFIDFQISHVNSPALDLNFFFITSAQLNVLQRKEELIRKIYYPSFAETLQKIGYRQTPSIDRILNEVKKRELFSLFNLFGELPIISLKPEDAVTANYGEFANEEIANKTREVGMSSERFLKTTEYALKYFEEVGVFK